MFIETLKNQYNKIFLILFLLFTHGFCLSLNPREKRRRRNAVLHPVSARYEALRISVGEDYGANIDRITPYHQYSPLDLIYGRLGLNFVNRTRVAVYCIRYCSRGKLQYCCGKTAIFNEQHCNLVT